MAISPEVRRKVLAAVERGESPKSIAGRFEIGERSVYRFKRRVREGRLIEPDKTGPKEPIKLTPEDMQLLRQSVDDRPGVTAKAMLPRLSVKVAECTVCRAWNRLGLSLKKVADRRGAEAAGGDAAAAELCDRPPIRRAGADRVSG